MDETGFARAFQPWHDFYVLTGTAAATLMGLMFVALSLKPEVMADHRAVGLRTWAAQTMSNLIALLVVSLFCLMPDLDVPALEIALLITGGQGLVRGSWRLRHAFAARREEAFEGILWRLVLPVGAYVVMLAVAAAMLRSGPDAIDWLVIAVFLLVTSAAGAAWELLQEMGRRGQTQAL